MTDAGYTEAEGYAASLRQQAEWIDNDPNGQGGDSHEMRAAAELIERLSKEIDRLQALVNAQQPRPCGGWTPDQFWEYVEGLTDTHTRDQMRDILASKGLSFASAQSTGELTDAQIMDILRNITKDDLFRSLTFRTLQDGCHVEGPALAAQRLAAEFRAAVPAVSCAQSTQWQPIETAPKDGTQVLLYFPKRYQGKGGVSWGCYIDGEWLDSRAIRDNDASHWMPMPGSPSVASTDGGIPPDWKQDQAETSSLPRKPEDRNNGA